MTASIKPGVVKKYMAEVSEVELAVRIAEVVIGVSRPEGETAAQALEHMDSLTRQVFIDAARVSLVYIATSFGEARRVQ